MTENEDEPDAEVPRCGEDAANGPCGNAAGAGTDHFGEGPCYHHDEDDDHAPIKKPGSGPVGNQNAVGNSGGGPPKGNSNAAKHNLQSDNSLLYERLDDDMKAEVNRMYTDLVERYESKHGDIGRYHDNKLMQISIEAAKEVLADNWMQEKSEEAIDSDNPLIEEMIVGQDEDDNPITVSRPNRVDDMLNRMSSRNRQWLKDLDLMPDAESRMADAAEDGASAWRSFITSGDDNDEPDSDDENAGDSP